MESSNFDLQVSKYITSAVIMSYTVYLQNIMSYTVYLQNIMSYTVYL